MTVLPFDRSKSHPAALTTSQYGLSKKELFKACFARETLLMKRNKFVYTFKNIQLIIIGLIASTLFLRTKLHKQTVSDGLVYMGALFFSLIQLLFDGYAELALTIIKLPIFYKQRDLRFYPA
ncbi:hypothetical protein Droror1_Dr00001049 [Drosera rotundifolia]